METGISKVLVVQGKDVGEGDVAVGERGSVPGRCSVTIAGLGMGILIRELVRKGECDGCGD